MGRSSWRNGFDHEWHLLKTDCGEYGDEITLPTTFHCVALKALGIDALAGSYSRMVRIRFEAELLTIAQN